MPASLFDIPQIHVHSWGIQPRPDMPQVENYTSPCLHISAFCGPGGDPTRIGRWRNSVIGFKSQLMGKDIVGVMVFQCPDCEVQFTTLLHAGVAEVYMQASASWRQTL